MFLIFLFFVTALSCSFCLENGVYIWGISNSTSFSPQKNTLKYCRGIFGCSNDICYILENYNVTSVILADFGTGCGSSLSYNNKCMENIVIVSRDENYKLITLYYCNSTMNCNDIMCDMLSYVGAYFLQIIPVSYINDFTL